MCPRSVGSSRARGPPQVGQARSALARAAPQWKQFARGNSGGGREDISSVVWQVWSHSGDVATLGGNVTRQPLDVEWRLGPMFLIVILGNLGFTLASLILGIRLCLLARRTRQLPETFLGIGFLAGGFLAFTLQWVAYVLKPPEPWLTVVI